MDVILNDVFVRSIAATLPDEIYDLTDLYDIYGENEVNQIMKVNGISKIRLAPEGVCASDLCEKAANLILTDNDKEKINGIVFISQTPDYILPATSACLQHRLGLSNECVAFDISNGCPGYIYGLFQAAMLINSGSCDSVLVCAGDVISRYINPLDRSNRMVFGDAGSATILEKGSGKISFSFMTDGSIAENLIIPAGGSRYPKNEDSEMVSVKNDGNMRSDEDLFMNGLEIMNFSNREVPIRVDAVIANQGWEKSDVTLFGFHQANQFMLNNLRKIMKIPEEKIPIAMQETGNTGQASIPLMLSLEQKNLVKNNRLEKSVLCGFGVGLSCAASALDLSETTIKLINDI
ncbi:3-oxoacyl-[acyl-carrier-protein] synthase III [Candidatus Magnetomorum sp. HK-1]|nr:3-oxoacyl-[acyl-carrier-protein] synthase III [Candidatus Magnetomorum sp. HK-1]